MALFIPNPSSHEPLTAQFFDYLQGSAYVTDLLRASERQIQEMRESSNTLLLALSQGLSEVVEGLHILDYKLTVIVEQERLQTLLLEDMREILKVPESQKERVYHLEKGLGFFLNAQENDEFYEDSRTELSQAIEKEPSDYVAHYYLGLLYLYSRKLSDPPQARKHLSIAGKYSSIDKKASSVELMRLLAMDPSGEERVIGQLGGNLNRFASNCYKLAAQAAYLARENSDVCELFRRGWQTDSGNLECGYGLVRMWCLLGEISQAVELLEIILRADAAYVGVASIDDAVGSREPLRTVIQKVLEWHIQRLRERIEACRTKMISTSTVADVVNDLHRRLQSPSIHDVVGTYKSLNVDHKISVLTFEGEEVRSSQTELPLEKVCDLEKTQDEEKNRFVAAVKKKAVSTLKGLNSSVLEDSSIRVQVNCLREELGRLMKNDVELALRILDSLRSVVSAADAEMERIAKELTKDLRSYIKVHTGLGIGWSLGVVLLAFAVGQFHPEYPVVFPSIALFHLLVLPLILLFRGDNAGNRKLGPNENNVTLRDLRATVWMKCLFVSVILIALISSVALMHNGSAEIGIFLFVDIMLLFPRLFFSVFSVVRRFGVYGY